MNQTKVKRRILLPLSLFIFLILILWMVPIQTFASIQEKILPLTTGWSYKWGDSPIDEAGVPVWTYQSSDNTEWNDFSFESWPMKRKEGQNTLWLRVQLSQSGYSNPGVYFERVMCQSMEVYLDSQKIYSLERMHPPINYVEFALNRIIIALGPNYYGKTLLLKINTETSLIGPYVDAKIGPYMNILEMHIHKDIAGVILGILFFILGICLIINIIFVKGENRKSLISLSLFIISLGVWVSTLSYNLNLVLWKSYNLWTYLNLLSTFLAPVFFLYFFEQIFGSGIFKIIKKSRMVNLLYSALFLVATLLSMQFTLDMGNFVFYLVYSYYAVIFIEFIIQILIVFTRAIKGNIDARIFSLGFIIYGMMVVYELAAYAITDTKPSFSQWGMLVLVSSFFLILGRRFSSMHDHVVTYSKQLEDKNSQLKLMWEEINMSRNQIAEWNKTLENTVAIRTTSLRNLLNNAGQGFLAFDDTLLVQKEYSTECIKIFGMPIEHKDFASLIYTDMEQCQYFRVMLLKILKEENKPRQELYMSLLPTEITINNKNISINYRILGTSTQGESQTFMVILTDITDKKFLENQMEKERKVLKMVVNAATNSSSFIQNIHDYNHFHMYNLPEILSSSLTAEEKLFEIYRHVHTFKGIFAQLGMVTTPTNLHRLESHLDTLKNSRQLTHPESFIQFIHSLFLEKQLDEDILLLKQTLGEQFFNSEKTFVIEKSKLDEIEAKIRFILSESDSNKLLPYVRRLRYKSIKSILLSFNALIMNTSKQLNKSVSPLFIEGDDVLMDEEKYRSFFQSLAHVFRNSIDHGIESPEERKKNQKPSFGKIKCTVKLVNHTVILSISDDGNGVNIDEVKCKAIEAGIIADKTMKEFGESELVNLIFTEDFSTKNNVSELSGRGIGLYAVKREVEKIGGTIEVHSLHKKGTEFIITFPSIA